MKHEQQIVKTQTRVKIVRAHPETLERVASHARGRKGRVGTVIHQTDHFWPHAGDLLVKLDSEDEPVSLFSSEVKVLGDAA